MKKISLILAILLVFSTVAFAIPEEQTKDWLQEDVKAGVEFGIEFPYEVDINNIDISHESVSYVGYDNGVHYFVSTEDLESVSGSFYYKKETGKNEEDHEGGTGNSVGRPGEGVGTEIDWGAFELGKHDWDTTAYEKNYAIRIDMSKYQAYDYIILEDISENLTLKELPTVSMLEPDDTGTVRNTGTIDYEVLINEDGKFALKLPVVKREGKIRYDVVYFMNHEGDTSIVSNKYRVYTETEWSEESSGGNLSGVCPIPEPCDHTELEDKIKELEKELEEKDKIIEELENREPERIYYTEVRYEKIIEEVKVPYYITEVRFKEIIKEIEKEVPYYITEVRFIETVKEVIKEVPVYYTELQIKEIIKEVVKEIPCEEDYEDIVLPIIPNEDNKEEEPKLEEQEKETNEEEIIEIPEMEEEIIEKEPEVPTEDIAEKTEKTDTPESIVSDDKEDSQPITLPKTGESKQLFYMIGSLMIIAGIILIKRYR